MPLIFPTTELIFDEEDCGVERFDDVFRECCTGNPDGYFLLSDGNDEVYLFVVAGRPYVSGSIEDGMRSTSSVQDFFNVYSGIKKGRLSYYKADKKLLRGIVVYFQKQSDQRFTPELVDMERVLSSLEAKGVDSLVATKCGDKMGLSICLKGRPSFNYLPDGAHAGEQPREAVLVYVFSEREGPLYIEVFEDIQVTAADDSISPKEPLPQSLTAYYTKSAEPEAAELPVSAEVAIRSEGKTLNSVVISKTETTIGRVPGNDIVIDDPAVSRQHAVIRYEDGAFFIEDKGSSNGTFINNEKITRRELASGDQVRIVTHTLVFSIAQPEAEKEDVSEKTMFIAPAEVKPKKAGISKLILDGNREHPLKSSITTIGSGSEMEITLKGLLIASHQASILRGRDGEFTLVHKGGLTATKVNGEKIQDYRLKDGDAITIGSYKISYVIAEQ